MQETFVLYRIIGNDLVPRHAAGQARANVRFILENEPDLPGCEKRWVVNRIVDPVEEGAVLALLDAHDQPYLHVPFLADDYRQVGWDLDALPRGLLTGRELDDDLGWRCRERAHAALCRRKNLYLINSNGARNLALADGRGRARWVLPWDGNCFVPAAAWAEIVTAVTAVASAAAATAGPKYVTVPTQRLADNADCLGEDFQPAAIDEPQLIFRNDAAEEFDPDIPWDRWPKVELLWRLGIPGPWDWRDDDPWDRPRRGLSPEARRHGSAGWALRLSSGVKDLDKRDKKARNRREDARREAIVSQVFATNRRVRPTPADPNGLAFYSTEALLTSALSQGDGDPLGVVAADVVAQAERALTLAPCSVMDKSLVAPSGDPHDYFSPPSPPPEGDSATSNESEPDQYDRTRLQQVLDGTTSLALGWFLTGRNKLAQHGAALVRAWFVDPATQMSPHLRHAQEVIELAGLYYFLDAVRLIEGSGALTDGERSCFRDWLAAYLVWLQASEQGTSARSATDHHGTSYDLQVVAIQSYLGDRRGLSRSFLRAMTRAVQQFDVGGTQAEEITGSSRKHNRAHNLQGWMHLLTVLRNSGYYDVGHAGDPYPRLVAALAEIQGDRIQPLLGMAASLGLVKHPGDGSVAGGPLDGGAPYWQLTLR